MGQKIKINWAVENLDTGERFIPQHPIDNKKGLSWELGGSWVEQKRFGFQNPLLAWTGGNSETFEFEVRLFAEHRDADIETPMKKFVKLGQKDEALGRPPLCIFVFGSSIGETVVFSPMSVTIDSTLDNGKPRDVTIKSTVKKYISYTQTRVDPSRVTKESFYLVASSSEATYEGLASKFYGDPMQGDRLRKRHPDMPCNPVVGSTVKIPSRSVILSEVVRPSSHVFDDTDQESLDAFSSIASYRNNRKVQALL